MSAILSYYHLVKFVKIVSDSSEVKRNNYYTTVAYKLWVSLYTSAIFKTNIQFPVENSIISPMAFMCVAVSAHYESNWKVNSKLEWEMYNKESEIPKGARWFIMHQLCHHLCFVNIECRVMLATVLLLGVNLFIVFCI